METEKSLTAGQTVAAVGVITVIATAVVVKMATTWVWRSVVEAFEGDALEDMYDFTDDDEVDYTMVAEVRG